MGVFVNTIRVGHTIVWSGIHECNECISRDTYFMTVVLGPMRAYEQRNQPVTLSHASVEWVIGRYFTPDTVLRDRRRK